MAKRTNQILSITVANNRLDTLAQKITKYPPYAIQKGLEAAEEYLNSDQFKESMYAPSQAGKPFDWSSDKQRKKVMALMREQGGPPYERTYELMRGGVFKVNEGHLTVEYTDNTPYGKYVRHPQFQIRGHQKRGWKPVSRFVVSKSKDIARVIREAVKKTWDEMERFIYGGGGGL